MVRSMGTLGGSLANNDPAADYPAATLGLGATIVTNERQIKADDFFTGMFERIHEDADAARCESSLFGHDLGCFFDRLDDVVVARAAAQISIQLIANLLFGREFDDLEQMNSAHDHSRGAIAAL